MLLFEAELEDVLLGRLMLLGLLVDGPRELSSVLLPGCVVLGTAACDPEAPGTALRSLRAFSTTSSKPWLSSVSTVSSET